MVAQRADAQCGLTVEVRVVRRPMLWYWVHVTDMRLTLGDPVLLAVPS